ncbi:MAG: hypothetical protein QM770_11740 [Tepidisphaeraceae bacterium]
MPGLMLRRSFRTLMILTAVATVQLPALAQPTQPAATVPAKDADVPVTRVALFSSGVGYFEHFGKVAGDGSTSVRFKADQINDVLKSLVLEDLDGGNVSVVRYPSQDPLGRSLKGFQVDLTGDTSLAGILTQLRGAQVEVRAQGGSYKGTVLSVETRKKVVGQGSIDIQVLNVVTETGVQSIAIDDAQAILLTDKELQGELNKALAAVATARDKDKKLVSVDFRGQGDRRVRLGYVVETPVWKTSYRLLVDEKDAKLQGWAIVENQTDNDWNNINLNLVSGRPISFVMDLYEPLYLARPEAKLELFEGLRPQSYAEAREEVAMDKMAAPATPAATAAPSFNRQLAARGGRAGGAGGALFSADAAAVDGPLNASSSVAAQASAGQIGELFQYTVNDVTLPRQSSAMIPIVTDPISVEKVSIYNRSVLARYPLNGARLENTTGKNLLQGPITVFEQGGYAGDAQINNVGPGQKRLISYGIDLQTLIDSDESGQTSRIISAKLVKGVLQLQSRIVNSQAYKMENKSDKAKTIVVEQPRLQHWTLVDSPKPVEETDALYRFEVKLDTKKADKLVVQQQTVNWTNLTLADFDENSLLSYSRNGEIPQKVREALAKAVELRQALSALKAQAAEAEKKIAEIAAEQNRIRENMRTVDKASQYYGRLVTKLNDQENQIEKLQTSLGELRDSINGKQKEYDEYLNGLNVE